MFDNQMFTGDNRDFFYCHLMSPNARYGKKTDMEVLEPINNVEKGGTMLIWWSGNKFSYLIRCINMRFGLYIYSVSR